MRVADQVGINIISSLFSWQDSFIQAKSGLDQKLSCSSLCQILLSPFTSVVWHAIERLEGMERLRWRRQHCTLCGAPSATLHIERYLMIYAQDCPIRQMDNELVLVSLAL